MSSTVSSTAKNFIFNSVIPSSPIITTDPLNGSNYMQWAVAIEHWLKGHR